MIVLLPPPQEMRYSDGHFTSSGREIVAMGSACEDATAEVILPALGESRIGRKVHAFPKGFDTALAIARNPSQAADLARKAANALETPIKNFAVYRDGPYMLSETAIARRLSQKLGCHNRDEAYSLLIEPQGIAVCSRSARGLFWGAQTLRQVLAGCAKGGVPCMIVRDWPNQRIRGAHLCMSQFTQKVSAIDDWLRGLAALKINTVLLQYDDKFPFERHPFLRHEAAITSEEIRGLLETARRHHVEIIPSVQSLGHMNYALRHEEFRSLREAPDIHSQACPTNPATLKFVCEQIDEMIGVHRDSEYFHVGGDETYYLGHCPRCKRAAKKAGPIGLYVSYIAEVLKHVIRRGKRPILWDDMVRMQPELVTRLPRKTILTYWDYGPTREEHLERKAPPALRKFYGLKSADPALWPDALSSFPYFDFYQRKGFEVIAIPCLNYGTIVPNYPHSARNTIKFAEKALSCDGLGTINSQWGCFRQPLSIAWYGHALTALCTWSSPPADTADFDVAFSRLIMGEETPALVEACAMIAEGVGFRIPGAGRPFNLLHYATMDAEIHLPHGLEDRMKRGGPPERTRPDFEEVVRRKIAMLRRYDQRADILARMDWVEGQMEAALRLLRAARPATERGKLALQILRAAGNFKLTRIATMRLLMGERSRLTPASALRAEKRCARALETSFSRDVRPRELKLEIKLLFSGETALLAAMARRKRNIG